MIYKVQPSSVKFPSERCNARITRLERKRTHNIYVTLITKAVLLLLMWNPYFLLYFMQIKWKERLFASFHVCERERERERAISLIWRLRVLGWVIPLKAQYLLILDEQDCFPTQTRWPWFVGIQRKSSPWFTQWYKLLNNLPPTLAKFPRVSVHFY